jgi:hypothetical protein
MQRHLSVKMASVVCCAVLFPAALQSKTKPAPLATIPLEPITIILRKAIVLESPSSLAERLETARELPIRIVRDVEGIALSVDGAVRTPGGLAWMELDSGNGGSLVVANHIAPLLGLPTDMTTPQPSHFDLANGITVSGTTRTRDLIMDGNIGAQFLNNWVLTLDLEHGRAWLVSV